MDFEKELLLVADQYSREGYAVVLHPEANRLPPFAADFGVDILASRGDECVLVRVKRDRQDFEADPKVPLQAEITNAQPGWRYDLVILMETDPLRRMVREAREPSDEEIAGALAAVDRMIGAGQLQAAFVFGWATLEAVMRRVARDAEMSRPRSLPVELLRTLYANGFLAREEFDRLNQTFRVRTEIVHGLVPPGIEPGLVRTLVANARRLLTGKPDAQNRAS